MSAKVQPAEASSKDDSARNYVTVSDIGSATATTTPSEKPNDAMASEAIANVLVPLQETAVQTTKAMLQGAFEYAKVGWGGVGSVGWGR